MPQPPEIIPPESPSVFDEEYKSSFTNQKGSFSHEDEKVNNKKNYLQAKKYTPNKNPKVVYQPESSSFRTDLSSISIDDNNM